MAVLASAHLIRVDAGHAVQPKISFGTRIMARVDPSPQNSFTPVAYPGVIFGPCDTVPGGYWIYTNGKVVAKVNIQVSGMNQREIKMMKAAFSDLEQPIAPAPPPDPALFDASLIEEELPDSIKKIAKKKSGSKLKRIIQDLADEGDLPEDPNPEEKPPVPLIHRYEEQPDEEQDPENFALAAWNHLNKSDPLRVHPHAALAMSDTELDESSIDVVSQLVPVWCAFVA